MLVTVDAATGKLLSQFELPRGHRLDHAPVIEGWDGNRVFVRPDCSACEGFLWDRLYMWEPQTGIIGEIPTQASVGNRRGLFGEHIRMEYDAKFPGLLKDWPKGIRGNSPFHPNTIRYYTDYKDPTPDVWYHDPANRKIIAARWVMGGQGFLFMATNETNDVRGRCYLGLRNGKVIEAYNYKDPAFLRSETPDGWIMGYIGNIDYYFVQDGEVRRKNLAKNLGEVRAILYTAQGTPLTTLFETDSLATTTGTAQTNPSSNASVACAGS